MVMSVRFAITDLPKGASSIIPPKVVLVVSSAAFSLESTWVADMEMSEVERAIKTSNTRKIEPRTG